MPNDESYSSVFDRTYYNYLKQLNDLIPKLSEERLGVSISGDKIIVPLLNKSYCISKDGIVGPSGERALFDICVILLKYLLTDRHDYPDNNNWCSFRDLRDSNPLIHYFKSNVEDAIVNEFTGDSKRLKNSCVLIGGLLPEDNYSHDISILFNLLPRIPVLMLFNNEDNVFPATCSVLFEQRSENYLDAECLAMAGRFLFDSVLETSI